MKGTYRGELKTMASALPGSDAILDLALQIVRPVLTQDAPDVDVGSLRPAEVLFEVLDHGPMATLVVLAGELKNVLGLDNVLADAADSGPAHVGQYELDLVGDAAVDEPEVVGLDPGDELGEDGREGGLVRDEGAAPGKDPGAGVEVALDGEERGLWDGLGGTPNAVAGALEPGGGGCMAVLGDECGELGIVHVVAVDGGWDVGGALVELELRAVVAVGGELAGGAGGGEWRGHAVGDGIGVVGGAVDFEDVEEAMHGH